MQGRLSGGAGFADSYYLPFILGWSTKRADVRVMYGFLAPTGRFVAGANNNVGSGYWTHAVSSGQTYYLTEDKRVIVSTFEMYEFHTTQEGTGVHPGETFDLDYSVMGLDSPHGKTGCPDRCHRIRGATDDGESGAGHYSGGIGGALRRQRFRICADRRVPEAKGEPRASAYYREFADRSTFQGYSAQVSGAINF